MKPCTRWVREHVEHIVFGETCLGIRCSVGAALHPMALPLTVDFFESNGRIQELYLSLKIKSKMMANLVRR